MWQLQCDRSFATSIQSHDTDVCEKGTCLSAVSLRESQILQAIRWMADRMGVQRLSISVTSVMLASVITFAQAPNGGGPGPVAGIVEIPEMFFIDANSAESAPRAALTLYTRPDPESKVAAVISWPQAVDEA